MRKMPAVALAQVVWITLALAIGALRAFADQVEMQNGDRYAGKVVALNTNTLVFQSEMLGTVTLPRAKVASVTLGANVGTNLSRATPTNNPLRRLAVPLTNGVSHNSPSLRQVGADTNLIRQVETQFLDQAGPEAKAKFNELLGGLMSGKLNVDDIRVQAKSAADQLKSLKGGQGDETGGMLDGYLAILEDFLKETAPSSGAATNGPSALPKPKVEPAEE